MVGTKDKTVIILNGHPRSGKTTVAKMLQDEYGATIRSSIDFVKEMAEVYFDWNGSKTEGNRKFLSDFKMFLSEHTQLIEDDLDTYRRVFNHSNDEFYIIDIREPEEIEKFKERYSAVTVFVDNPRAEKVTSNSSDANVLGIEYDYTIDNWGSLEGLKLEVDRFVMENRIQNRG